MPPPWRNWKTCSNAPLSAVYFRHAGLTNEAFLADLQLHADMVIPVPTSTPIRDERDRPFLNLLATKPPPHYFVTGDQDFEASHYSGGPVISATACARLLTQW